MRGWYDGEPDPRALQLAFTLTVLGVLVLRAVGDPSVEALSWPVIGAGVAALGTAAVVLAPPARRRPITRVLAVADVAVLGMFAAGTDVGGASPLLVLPALWLGADLGLRGAAVAVAAVLAFITAPGLLAHGVHEVAVERLLVLPIVAGVGAAAITAGLTAARAAQARAEAHEAELLTALAVIERSERSARAIFEAVDVGLALFDGEGRPTLGNQRLAEFADLAYPGGDLAAAQVFDESGTRRLAIEDVPTARAQHGEEFDGLRIWIGPEGPARRAVSVSARRVEDSAGELLGAAVSYSDVTDFMRALEVKDEFIALVSHELRTPLTSIVGYVDIALDDDGDLDPLLRRQLEVVARNARRLERLVDDLLDEVQHPRRQACLLDQQVDLAALVRESVVGARPAAAVAGVTLHEEVPDTLLVTGDPQRLSQVVDNLLSNALKYTPSGGRAEVRVEAGSETAVIRISDTGIGIDPADHEQVFARFFRTHEANRRAIQGIGLGLAISRSVVEAHGGRIEVDSAPGRGSEFRVVLPLRRTP